MHIRTFRGPVLPQNRIDQVSAAVSTLVGNTTCKVFGEYVHVVALTASTSDFELNTIERLLHYETGVEQGVYQAGTPSFLTVPRFGTVSPWSSKATEIFKLCVLEQVHRVERGIRWWVSGIDSAQIESVSHCFFDRMTESLLHDECFDELFVSVPARELNHIELKPDAYERLAECNEELGLALNALEIQYLVDLYLSLNRAPTDAELMMFAQANSEHCRHKIFNASWNIEGRIHEESLFDAIRHTAEIQQFRSLLSAYKDNAAVIEHSDSSLLYIDAVTKNYEFVDQPVGLLMKVETHNHPTAISPYHGAATGSGGEIRDEGAVGRGSKPKAGLVGFTTSHLRIPNAEREWERSNGCPHRIASAFEIMRDGPIGAANYNNEFGRPALLGYFRTFEFPVSETSAWGYHKPVMIAGGLGSIRQDHVSIPQEIPDPSLLVVIGGPALLIGLGGGAASSMGTGSSDEALDFASVQRDNAEMERRCQEVIDRCTALGFENPVLKIHDVGAGGLSNALPELAKELDQGARIALNRIPNADPSMSPMELWCNEAQERYVLSLDPKGRTLFETICKRERCPFAIVGETNSSSDLVVVDETTGSNAVELPLAGLFGNPPKLRRSFERNSRHKRPHKNLTQLTIDEAIRRVLELPCVASKKFLVTIGDRSITGFVVQEQMIGPRQVPIADAAITSTGFRDETGEVMTMGERSPLAVISPAASARMAIAESLTNMCGVRIKSLDSVVVSANWMAAAGHRGEDQALYEAVTAVGRDFCPKLGIAIPVGKDSLSMKTQWEHQEVVSPLTLIASAFAHVPNVHDFKPTEFQASDSKLALLSLTRQHRLGASAIAQVSGELGDEVPDVEDPMVLRELFNFVQEELFGARVLSVHDRSDGGLFTTCLEQAIASQIGVRLSVNSETWLSELFNEEIGLVVEVEHSVADDFQRAVNDKKFCLTWIGNTTSDAELRVVDENSELYCSSLRDLEIRWSNVSYEMQRRRDSSACADEERQLIGNPDFYLSEHLTFERQSVPSVVTAKPEVAILREQGVNGHIEMAAAFIEADFNAVDVHMSDILSGEVSLDRFQVLAACGGFSYGDVLGGGGGWAKSILLNNQAREEFAKFFNRETLSLGICNGCQMLSQLKEIIPGADHFETWLPNRSGRFEGRTVQVRIEETCSPWLDSMAGSRIPVPVAHGEGQLKYSDGAVSELAEKSVIAMRYVDGTSEWTEHYPMNPNGSPQGVAGLVNESGRVCIAMPHPERVFRSMQQTWRSSKERRGLKYSGWMRLFWNARKWIG